ncbi:MAG: serine/threonine protein kinase [Cyanobacteria bacterium SZAS-4]|nr:serine/threonine protein kinase [Cyanobacteria bacterium SZAS-4]
MTSSSQNISDFSNQPVLPDWDPFEVGQILDDKYRVVSLLGKGGMGAVYRVTQLLLNVDVALKTLNTQKQNDVSALRRFQTEARAAFSLKHPNLVNVHDFGVLQNSYPFLVMELINGLTLQQFIQQRGTLSPYDIQAIFVRLCFALSYAHQSGVVHRDIKPGNIMLKTDVPFGDEGCVKILDFGLAKVMNTLNVDLESLTKTGDVVGSPLYMSPEQCSGAPLDHRTDIYSLGCVLFEALTGTPPLVGTNSLRTMMLHQTARVPTLKEAALGRDFPPALEMLVSKMLAKAPADRYTDLGVVAMELSAICSGKELPSIAVVHNEELPKPSDATAKNQISFSWKQFSLLMLAVVFAFTATGYALSQLTRPASNAALPTEAQTARDAKEIADKNGINEYNDALRIQAEKNRLRSLQTFLEAKPIVAVEIQRGGKPFRRVNFPDASMGDVQYSFFGEGSQKFKLPAVKEQDFPPEVPLVYHLSDGDHADVVSNSFIFDKIDQNIFSGLNFSGSLKGQSPRGAADEGANENSTNELSGDERIGTLHLVQVACKWPKLSDLCLSSTEITKEMGENIRAVDALKRLTIRSCKLDPKDLFDQKLTRQLERIDLEEMPADAVLDQLSGSTNLKILNLGKGCSAVAASLAKLQTCPNLDHLFLTMSPMNEEQLQAVLKIKSLTKLAVNTSAINDAQTKEILAQKWTPAPSNQRSPDDIHTNFFKSN